MASKKATAKMAKAQKKVYCNWTVFLLKPDHSSKDKYLSPAKKDATLAEHIVTIPGAKSAILYTKQIAESSPSWAKHFRDIAIPPVSVKSRAASAVLVVTTDKSTYALSFGFGRSLINTDAWEEEFGLKVVLNNIGDEGIKQIQLSAFDALLQSKQAQSVRNARIDEFGLDVEQDVIRSLTGVPSDNKLGRTIGGRDSLRISTETELKDISSLLDRIFADSSKDDYLKTFSWIGRMKEVRSKELRAKLDAKLVEKIISKNLERMWIAPPSYQDWEAGRMFTIPGIEDLQDDLRLQDILDAWEETDGLSSIDVNDLKAKKISAINDAEQEVEKWSIYKALYCEIDLTGQTYLLNNAAWYKIDAAYLKEINDSIANFPKSTIILPDYNDDSEEAYNIRVANGSQNICLMDQKFIQLKARGYTKVEFCDLVSINKELIHVKRYSGSSTLSHLFAQGIVPAELFLNVSEFREKVNLELRNGHKLLNPRNPIDPKDYEIVYGIISKSAKDVVLPIFSKVMLRNARTVLENMNYRVSLCKIKNIYKPVKKNKSSVNLGVPASV